MIGHVALELRQIHAEACAGFWQLLGFERVQPPEALVERALWLQRGDTQIHLLFDTQPVVPLAGHVAVVVEDYDATLRALEVASVEVRPRTEYWGSPRAFVRCPAGHRVEIMAFAPPRPD